MKIIWCEMCYFLVLARTMATPRERKFYKVVMIGDANVGKTCLLERLVKDHYVDNYKATIGSDFLTKDMMIDGKMITLQLWV